MTYHDNLELDDFSETGYFSLVARKSLAHTVHGGFVEFVISPYSQLRTLETQKYASTCMTCRLQVGGFVLQR